MRRKRHAAGDGVSNGDAERARARSLRVRSPAVHALAHPGRRRLGRGAVNLPEHIAAEKAHLIRQLAQARVARIVLGAASGHGADVLRCASGARPERPELHSLAATAGARREHADPERNADGSGAGRSQRKEEEGERGLHAGDRRRSRRRRPWPRYSAARFASRSGKPMACRCASHASATPLAIPRTRPMKRWRSVTPMAPRASSTLNACAPFDDEVVGRQDELLERVVANREEPLALLLALVELREVGRSVGFLEVVRRPLPLAALDELRVAAPPAPTACPRTTRRSAGTCRCARARRSARRSPACSRSPPLAGSR